MRFQIASLFVSLFLVSIPAFAQETLKDPSTFLGYELGSRFSRHSAVVDYFNHVAEASDRVQTSVYGQTNEGRPLMVAFVSSPENISRLEQIRHDNLKRAKLEDGNPGNESVAIVWLSYNVHGNESNSTEASMATLFALADPSNQSSSEWLKNTVVVLDPAINPDGRDRYANWYNMVVGTKMNVSEDAIEHHEPWPGGRTNHYYFDLNRDWSWQTQVESQQRMDLYKRWLPHVHVDFHEQGVNSPYYFAPAAEPIHEEVTPWQRAFEEVVGRNNAKYFDRFGWLYFTKQSFDIYYPGYGDSFPMFNGAIGMTYEQAGGGGAGLGIKTAEGDTLTLLDRLTHHTTTGLSTVEMASVHNKKLLAEFSAYFEQAVSGVFPAKSGVSSKSATPNYWAYVIKKSTPGDRISQLVAHLDKLGISYGQAKTASKVDGYDYRSAKNGRFDVTAGDLVVPAAQPRAVLTRVLFNPLTPISDSLTYDITAWALPYAYDLEAVASKTTIATEKWMPVGPKSENHSENPYAYVIAWDDAQDAAFLASLLNADIRVRYTTKPFSVHGQKFPSGSLIVTRTSNQKFGSTLPDLLARLAKAHGQQVTGIATGYVDEGSDLGSSDVQYIKAPRAGMAFGDGTSSSATGEVWHWFDQVIDYPLTRFSADQFSSIDLGDYDVLIMPSAVSSMLSESGLEKLSGWIQSGGRLVASGGGASALADKKGFSLTLKPADKTADSTAIHIATNKRFEDRSRDRAPESNPGAIYRVRVDNSHPLGFGFGNESFVLRSRADHPAIMQGGSDWNVGVVEKNGRVSGFTGHIAEQRIEGSLAFGVQGMGSGSVTYLLDNPLYRGFWTSGKLLFANAVFLVGQ
ncbi:MAG: M14 family metallopeptidase [Bacteroidetes bacterium]|nr:M14 family metallopeptidase [Bacteroidota bacterium]